MSGYTNVCDRKTVFVLQIWHYLNLRYLIYIVTVECIIKEMRPTSYSFYCIDRDSSYMFRLCKVAIIRLLISEV